MSTEKKNECCCGVETGPCCGAGVDWKTQAGPAGIKSADSRMKPRNYLNHILARWGVNRSGWRVEPGLYRIGSPNTGSPVFVTANYQLSFDALRRALRGIDGYILVLDTKGVNVWCAAGKGTFGTDELISRIKAAHLADVVAGRRLILPQLGATGVAASVVRERSGFKVDWGPIRAEDIPEYLRTGKTTPEMRKVRFNLMDRLVLIPVEIKQAFTHASAMIAAVYLLDGKTGAAGAAGAVAAGIIGVPVLLPWLPVKDYSNKGFLLGGAVGLGTAIAALTGGREKIKYRAFRALSYILALPPVTAYISLNYTGVTPYTSPSGVKKEISRYVPIMAGMTFFGIIIGAAQKIARLLKE